MTGTSLRVTRHESAAGTWENIARVPGDALSAHVLRYTGYHQHLAPPAAQRHVPGPGVTLIIGFDAPMRNHSRYQSAVEQQSFVAGLFDSPVITENTGRSSGVQVDLTPLGAHLLFGRPAHELANGLLTLEDAFGADGPLLAEALFHARAWDLRFDLLDAALAARFAHARPASPAIAWAWRAIGATGGNVSITSLAERIGWSRKHLVGQFREQIGLPPKTYARVVRFDRAVSMMRPDEEVRWTEIAQSCGYYDQAHFIRDFRQFAGVSPTRYLDAMQPGGPVLVER